MSECPTTCGPEALCLMQQQLAAQSLVAFANLVTVSHNADLEYLKTSQMINMAAIGKAVPTTPTV